MSELVDFSRALVDPNIPPPSGLREVGGRIPVRRFNVYRNNVIVSLCEALAQTFPVTRQVVGDEFFAAMAREFVLAHPPRSPVMSGYGEEFPDFVRAFDPAQSVAYLAELAQLEFLRIEAFHAADAAPLSNDALADLPPDQLFDLRFKVHPATRLLTSSFAVASLWFAHHGLGNLEDVEPSRPEAVLITRPELSVQLYHLSDGLWLFLSMLLAGEPMGVAAQRALSLDPEHDLTTGLTILLDSGAATAIVLDKETSHGST